MRFTQPDTMIPNPGNPQSYNRFSYVNNNPVKFIDPTGHRGRTITPCKPGVPCHYRENRIIPPGSSNIQWDDTGNEFSPGNPGGPTRPGISTGTRESRGGAPGNVEDVSTGESESPKSPSISLSGEVEYKTTIGGSWIEFGTFANTSVMWGNSPFYANDYGFGIDLSSQNYGYLHISFDYSGIITVDAGLPFEGTTLLPGNSGIGGSYILDTTTGPIINFSQRPGWTTEGHVYNYMSETVGNQDYHYQRGVYGKDKKTVETVGVVVTVAALAEAGLGSG
jgi:hypothetical protein